MVFVIYSWIIIDKLAHHLNKIRCSVTAIIPVFHTGDRGSIPRTGISFFFLILARFIIHLLYNIAPSYINVLSILITILTCVWTFSFF